MTSEFKIKRRLGNGRWDKILKARMLELSVSDNYDTAKHEWTATGNCWWDDMGEDAPDWAKQHPYQCLCTHRIVYHFEILNTENGVRECVGSDHINSYLILKEIVTRTGVAESDITDEMISLWIKEKVDSMIKTAWWKNNGEHFKLLFNTVKDYDLRVNVRDGRNAWDATYRMMRPRKLLRKRAEGKPGFGGYAMASIVWRWNHPDNPKAQINTRGYPNERLYQDLIIFYCNLGAAKTSAKKEDERLEKRLADIKKTQEDNKLHQKEETKRRDAVVKSLHEHQTDPLFEESCDYYGIRVFSPEEGGNAWEIGFLTDIKRNLVKKKVLSERQLEILSNILVGESATNQPATIKQRKFLIRLGFEGDLDTLNKASASEKIGALKAARYEKE